MSIGIYVFSFTFTRYLNAHKFRSFFGFDINCETDLGCIPTSTRYYEQTVFSEPDPHKKIGLLSPKNLLCGTSYELTFLVLDSSLSSIS